MEIKQLPTVSVYPSKTNPRKEFSPEDQAELVRSILAKGIQTPIQVRKRRVDKNGHEMAAGYEIIDGERRYKAAVELKLLDIPGIVLEVDDGPAFEMQLVSHLQRKNIHPMEEAEAFGSLLSRDIGHDLPSIAKLTGKDITFVAKRLKLLDLIEPARKLYTEGVLTIDHATLLAKLVEEDQKRALDWLVEGEAVQRKGKWIQIAQDVKLFEDWVESEITLNLSKAPFDTKDDGLLQGVVDCLHCPKNSGFNTALFPELSKHHVCGDRHCFNAKVQAHMLREKSRARKELKAPFIMVSKQYRMDQDDPLKVKDVKMAGRYVVVKKQGECENTKRAQWIDGPNKGKFLFVCNYSKCKKHWKVSNRYSGSSPRTAESELKSRRSIHDRSNREARRILIASEAVGLVAGRIKLEDTLKVFREVVRGELISGRFDSDDAMTAFFALDPKVDFGHFIQGATDIELAKAATFILNDKLFDRWNDRATPLNIFVNKHKLKLKDIEKRVDEKISKTPKCEFCHCTEADACLVSGVGKCSWDPGAFEAGRHVCSACTQFLPKEKKDAA